MTSLCKARLQLTFTARGTHVGRTLVRVLARGRERVTDLRFDSSAAPLPLKTKASRCGAARAARKLRQLPRARRFGQLSGARPERSLQHISYCVFNGRFHVDGRRMASPRATACSRGRSTLAVPSSQVSRCQLHRNYCTHHSSFLAQGPTNAGLLGPSTYYCLLRPPPAIRERRKKERSERAARDCAS